MRVTIDIDFFKHNLKIEREWMGFHEFRKKYYDKLFKKWKTTGKILFWYRIILGYILMRKFPEIRVTSKGLHLVWRNNKISVKKMFKYRLLLGDDLNRLYLDMISWKRINQVLFTKKEITYYKVIE